MLIKNVEKVRVSVQWSMRERENVEHVSLSFIKIPPKKKCNKIKYYVEMSSYQLWDLLGPMLDWSCDS